ncbi:MAG: hypothetical protein MJ239_06895 [Bacilli bacterium]|nr:hypothetical protein [Bacilli bacterium]
MEEEKKKQRYMTTAMARHLELVEKYYEVDRENRIIFLRLHYEKATDILDLDIGDKNRPSFKTSTMARVVDIIGTFPEGFKVDVQFQIDDYQGYDPKILVEAFNDEFEFNHFCSNSDNRVRWLKAALLVMTAVVIIFVQSILSEHGLLGEGILNQAYSLVLETVATLFVWEAATVLFLTLSGHRVMGAKILARVSHLTYLSSDGKEVAKEDKLTMISNWVDTGKVFKVGGVMLIFFASATLVTGVSKAIADGYTYVQNPASPGDTAIRWIGLVVSLTVSVLVFLSGLGYYADKGKLRKAAHIFAFTSVTLFFFETIALIILFFTGTDITFGMFARNAVGLIVRFGFIIGYGLVAQSRLMRGGRKRESK